MHIIYEGVLPKETHLLLRSLVEDGRITLELLNERVMNFMYGKKEASLKPPKMFEKSHILSPKGRLHLSGS